MEDFGDGTQVFEPKKQLKRCEGNTHFELLPFRVNLTITEKY